MIRSGLSLPVLGLILANLLIPVALLTFATGFFPYKPFLPGFAQREKYGPSLEAPFDKVIFMVVDALRSDFVYSKDSGFSYTQSLIRDGSAIPFTAHATSPTITMPRVKAITTGSIPSFLDVILNFAESDTSSTLADQDTWLAQMKLKEDGKKLVMYGDDTWLKLFPHTFSRADGTSSFFVSDFTEVDNNVTRHVPRELQNDDWNTMVLHYLGLDHIGHKAGPRSPHMVPKQQEMDGMVETIYKTIQREEHLHSTLLVLCGDHGMNDAGNHGGSSPGETSPALVFMSPKLEEINKGSRCPTEEGDGEFQYYSTVEQSDIAPTLAGLLGVPVPLNNLGVIIPQLLGFWSASDQIRLASANARQIFEIVKATFSESSLGLPPADCSSTPSDAEELNCRWHQASSLKPGDSSALASLIRFSRRAQEIMSSTASNYSLPRLNLGIFLSVSSFVLALASSVPLLLSKASSFPPFLILLAISISYSTLHFASSYVEEEQHFWYWTTSFFLVYLFLRSTRHSSRVTLSSTLLTALPAVLLLALHRVATRFNQTGQKHTSSPDIAHHFLTKHNLVLLVLVVATYLSLLRRLTTRCFPATTSHALRFTISTGLILAALAFKLSFVFADAPELLHSINLPPGVFHLLHHGSQPAALITQARAVFFGLLLTFTFSFFTSIRPLDAPRYLPHDLLALLLVTQTRYTSIPVFLIFEQQFSLLQNLPCRLTAGEISIISLLMQYTAFFAMGGSNAISSIDLSSAYNGVGGYNVLAVGILTFVSNWAGTIFWVSATSILLLQCKEQSVKAGDVPDVKSPKVGNAKSPGSGRQREGGGSAVWTLYAAVQTLFVTAGMVGVMSACLVLRQHLFVWTVFSPKYLYSMAWGVGGHLIASLGLGSLLHWLGSGWRDQEGQQVDEKGSI